MGVFDLFGAGSDGEFDQLNSGVASMFGGNFGNPERNLLNQFGTAPDDEFLRILNRGGITEQDPISQSGTSAFLQSGLSNSARDRISASGTTGDSVQRQLDARSGANRPPETNRRPPPIRPRNRAPAAAPRPQAQTQSQGTLNSLIGFQQQILATQQARVQRQQALANIQRQNLSRTTQRFGQFVDRATTADRDRNLQQQQVFRDLMASQENDPLQNELIQSVRGQLDGLPQSVLDQIQGARASRNAASQSSLTAQSRANAGAGGINGQQLSNQLQGIRLNSASDLSAGLASDQTQFEVNNFSARQNAQQQLQSLLSQRFGRRSNVANNLAQSIGGFSELDSLRRGQQLTQPLAAFGQQLALGGDSGRIV